MRQLRAVTGRERCLQDREAAWREQRPSDALESAGSHKPLRGRRQAAEQRRGSEPDDSDNEDPSTPEPVAQGTADEDEGRERERVAVHDPLQAGDARMQLSADRGSATFTTVASRNAMLEPSTVASRIQRASGVPHVTGPSSAFGAGTTSPPRTIVFDWRPRVNEF
jgi:hypothetical protein